jgi:hypothetical protein
VQGRDLSPITDELWLKCYSRKFGNDAVEMVKRRMADRKCKFKWKQLYQVQRWLPSWGNGQICILMKNLRCGNHAVRGLWAFFSTLEFAPLGFSGLKFAEAENPKGANSRELKGHSFCSKDILKGVVP